MKPKNVIEPAALPTRAPLLLTAVGWLVLDRVGAVGWPWGVFWTVIAIIWLGFAVSFWRERFKKLDGFGD